MIIDSSLQPPISVNSAQKGYGQGYGPERANVWTRCRPDHSERPVQISPYLVFPSLSYPPSADFPLPPPPFIDDHDDGDDEQQQSISCDIPSATPHGYLCPARSSQSSCISEHRNQAYQIASIAGTFIWEEIYATYRHALHPRNTRRYLHHALLLRSHCTQGPTQSPSPPCVPTTRSIAHSPYSASTLRDSIILPTFSGRQTRLCCMPSELYAQHAPVRPSEVPPLGLSYRVPFGPVFLHKRQHSGSPGAWKPQVRREGCMRLSWRSSLHQGREPGARYPPRTNALQKWVQYLRPVLIPPPTPITTQFTCLAPLSTSSLMQACTALGLAFSLLSLSWLDMVAITSIHPTWDSFVALHRLSSQQIHPPGRTGIAERIGIPIDAHPTSYSSTIESHPNNPPKILGKGTRTTPGSFPSEITVFNSPWPNRHIESCARNL